MRVPLFDVFYDISIFLYRKIAESKKNESNKYIRYKCPLSLKY